MTNLQGHRENFILTFGAGMITLMALYGLTSDLLGMDRAHVRNLVSITLGIMSASFVIRWFRLRHLGAQILVTQLPDNGWSTKRTVLWLLGALFLGAYSTHEVASGGLLLGTIGCLVSAAMALVLVRRPLA